MAVTIGLSSPEPKTHAFGGGVPEIPDKNVNEAVRISRNEIRCQALKGHVPAIGGHPRVLAAEIDRKPG